MGLEIERKFLVIPPCEPRKAGLPTCGNIPHEPRKAGLLTCGNQATVDFHDMATSSRRIIQGYLNLDPARTVRIRLTASDGQESAFITIKGKNQGATRHEWEYPIPVADAREMLALCNGLIDKTRYLVPFDGRIWEVDEFHGALAPLILAEVELPSESAPLTLPPFIGPEVTSDPAFYNSSLLLSTLK